MDAISSTSALAGLMPAFSAGAGAPGTAPPFSLAGEARKDLAGVRGGVPAGPVASARAPQQPTATAPRGRENAAAERRDTTASSSTSQPRAADHGGRRRTPESEPPPDGGDARPCAGADTATGCSAAPPEEAAARTGLVGEDRPSDGKILPPWLAWIAAPQAPPDGGTPVPALASPAARVTPQSPWLPGMAAPVPSDATPAPGQPALPAWPAAGVPVGLPFNPLSGDPGDPPALASVSEATSSPAGALLESLDGNEPSLAGRLPAAAPAGAALAASATALEGLVRRLGQHSRDGATAGPQPPAVAAGGAARPDAPPLPPPIQAAAAPAGADALPVAPTFAKPPTDADASSPQEPGVQSVQDLRGPLMPLQSAPAARPPAIINLHAPVGSEQWSQALGERVQWLADQNFTQAQIKLNPAQLGPIEIRVQVNGDQATVQFTAHNHVTRDALEQAMPRLRDMLGANGFNTVDVNVAQHSFSERPQHQPQAQHYEPLKDWWVPPDPPAVGQTRGWTRAAATRLDAYA